MFPTRHLITTAIFYGMSDKSTANDSVWGWMIVIDPSKMKNTG